MQNCQPSLDNNIQFTKRYLNYVSSSMREMTSVTKESNRCGDCMKGGKTLRMTVKLKMVQMLQCSHTCHK